MLNDVELQLAFDIFEIDRSSRRGGENRTRLDFSTRRETSFAIDGAIFFTSSCVGLKNRARFDVSRVAVPNFGATVINLLALFLSDPGVFRPMKRFRMNIVFL